MKFKNIKIKQGQKVIINEYSGTIPTTGIISVVGPNGIGKTTLLKALAGLIPYEGVILDQATLTYLPQKNRFYDAIKVDEFLGLVPTNHPQAGWRKQVFKQLDIADLQGKNVNTLSGGQQQRVWLAFSLIQSKSILMLDEPLTYLDLKYQQRFLSLISTASQFCTIIQIVHDLNIANQYSDIVWLLTAKTLLAGTPTQVLTATNLNIAFATTVKIHRTSAGQRWFSV